MRLLFMLLVMLQEGRPAIDLPQPVNPPPQPVMPEAVTAFDSDQIYLIQSDVALHVFASPAGVVEITPEPEGTRIRGRFAGGSKATESRKVSRKFGYLVEGIATGKVELLVLPVGSGEPPDLQRILLEVTAPQLPQPPPRPQPVDELARWCVGYEAAWRKAYSEQAERLESGLFKSEPEAEAWLSATLLQARKDLSKDLLQQQFDEVGGERWTAEKHAAWLRRFQR